MSRIIGVLNYKGGTGKTTTVINLAAGLALRGSRVLCIDLDAQGSLAAYLGVHPTYTLTHLLLGQVEPQECIVPVHERLDLIASDRSLLQAEGNLWRMADESQAREALASRMRAVNGYDFILLDYSPSVSLLGQNGLFYAHEIIVPVSMNHLSLIGTRQVVETLKAIGRTPQHAVRLSWIVPTFYAAHLKKDREIMETLKRHFTHLVTEPIRANVALAEAASRQLNIYRYAPRSTGAVDYALLVERVANHGG